VKIPVFTLLSNILSPIRELKLLTDQRYGRNAKALYLDYKEFMAANRNILKNVKCGVVSLSDLRLSQKIAYDNDNYQV
jgi:hypothetical protein